MKRIFVADRTSGCLNLLVVAVLAIFAVPAHASCTPPNGGGVNVCFPGSGTTQANPVHFIAAASTTCSSGISAIGIYSAPNNRVYLVNGSTLDTFLPLSPGTYTTTVQEWDNCGGSLSTNVPITVSGTAAYTYQYNNQRTGANTFETTLTPSNVNSTSFGKKFSYSVDAYIMGQPLYVPHMSIAGGTHNVVFVATENNSIYAFDADGGGQLWHHFIDTPVPCGDVANGCEIASPGIGITSTPVIDPTQGAHGAIYVEARTAPGGVAPFWHGLHKLDLATGAEMSGSPNVISASANGVTFNKTTANNRPALLYADGAIYLGFTSPEPSTDPGWVLGYDAVSMNQLYAFNTAPASDEAGLWGAALAGDLSNFVYADTGNHNPNGPRAWGNSYIKLAPSGSTLSVVDWFTPFNESTLSADDLDLGSATAILLPLQPGSFPHEMIGAGKEGRIYVVNRDNMGHMQAGSDSQIIQSIPGALGQSPDSEQNFTSPAYWNGHIYFFSVFDNGKAFSLTNGLLSTSPTSVTPEIYSCPLNPGVSCRGATPTVSSNGNSNGIVWAVKPGSTSQPAAILYAYDATNLANELYNSNQNSSRDALGNGVKFAPPLVMNGKVYVGTRSALVVYGPLP